MFLSWWVGRYTYVSAVSKPSDENRYAFVACFPDEVFQAPAEHDGGVEITVEGAPEFTAALDDVLRTVVRPDTQMLLVCSSKRSMILAATSRDNAFSRQFMGIELLCKTRGRYNFELFRDVQGGRDGQESDAPPMKQRSIERAKEVSKNGIVGAVLVLRDGMIGAAVFVTVFGEQIVEAADRWNDLADGGLGKAIPITLILGLVLLVWVSAYLSRKLVGRFGRYRLWCSSPTHRD